MQKENLARTCTATKEPKEEKTMEERVAELEEKVAKLEEKSEEAKA